jgi:hypothetical protein
MTTPSASCSHIDDDNYYRFSMDSERSYRRLVKKVAGVVSTLWQDSVAYTVGQSYDLSIRAAGTELRAHLDGAPLFTVHDHDLRQGSIAFYCWGNTGAHFERVLVTDATRRIGGWMVRRGDRLSLPWATAAERSCEVEHQRQRDSCLSRNVRRRARASWMDYRLTATMRADAIGAIGVLFRYRRCQLLPRVARPSAQSSAARQDTGRCDPLLSRRPAAARSDRCRGHRRRGRIASRRVRRH